MTRALRRRHRQATLTLATVLPAAVAIALAARPVPPLVPLPAPFAAPAPALLRTSWRGEFGDSTLHVRATIGEIGGGAHAGDPAVLSGGDRVVAIEVESALGRPELLVYWTAHEPIGPDLPVDAILLGALAARNEASLGLPASAGTDGALVLYDPAHARIAASAVVRAGARAEARS